MKRAAFMIPFLLVACAAPAEPPAEPPEQSGQVIVITAHNFLFTPSVITVKKGTAVTLRLQGVAGTHGFAIPAFRINTTIAAGKTVDVQLPTDSAGTFEFFCSVSCGPDGTSMRGTITVLE